MQSVEALDRPRDAVRSRRGLRIVGGGGRVAWTVRSTMYLGSPPTEAAGGSSSDDDAGGGRGDAVSSSVMARMAFGALHASLW